MSFSKPDIDSLRLICSRLEVYTEGQQDFILLPDLQLPAGCVPEQSTSLFCPTPRSGYDSRLYFEKKIQTAHSLNWNGNERILERNWYAFSWQVNEQHLTLVQGLAAHLRGLRNS